MLHLTVGRNGEDYYTIQEALDAVPYEVEAEIVISQGVYEEKIFSDKRRLSMRGEGDVTIRWSDGAKTIMPDGIKRGTFRTYTAFFSGEELHLENLRIENNAGLGRDVGQALALYLDVDRAFLDDVDLHGHQDTLFLAPLPEKEREKRGFYGPRCFLPRKLNRVLYRGGSISGGVDFIFGGADALFDGVRIISNEPGYVSAPSGGRDDIGFVFHRCSFENDGLEDGSVYLMRPWRPEGKGAFLSCSYGSHIHPDGFIPWNGLEDEASLASFRTDGDSFPSIYHVDGKESLALLNDFCTAIGIARPQGI